MATQLGSAAVDAIADLSDPGLQVSVLVMDTPIDEVVWHRVEIYGQYVDLAMSRVTDETAVLGIRKVG